MNISILTVFPEMFGPFFSTSLIKRALDQKLINVNLIKYSELCSVKERIDEQLAGPGSGMIIKPVLIEAGIKKAEDQWGAGFKIFFSPQGKRLDQNVLKAIKAATTKNATPTPEAPATTEHPAPHIILISTRYEGIDARVEEEYANAVVSIGDYVLMGGDLPAQVFLEAFFRLFPGIVGNQESVDHESFSEALLDYPQFGQTATWHNKAVPDIVKSGHHQAINDWRHNEACRKTVLNRFDWFREHGPTVKNLTQARTIIPSHYAVLMHSEVLMKDGSTGTSSITSIDIHDIARSSATYGIKNYFIVTKLDDQTELVKIFLDFWQSKEGKDYNNSRFNAMSRVRVARSLDEVVETITEIENKHPLLLSTGAKDKPSNPPRLDYHSQGHVWQQDRPVLFIFGTSHGLSEAVINRSDYLLLPISGMTTYNHLSVRSAAAIIFDRWFGLNPRLEGIKDVDMYND